METIEPRDKAGLLAKQLEQHARMVELLEKYGHEIQGIVNVRRIQEDDSEDDPQTEKEAA